MIESDLSLEDAQSLTFVEHARCRESNGCPEEKIAWHTAAAQTLAFLLGNDLHCVDHLLSRQETLNAEGDNCVNYLWSALGRKKERFGGVLTRSKSTEDVLLGALALFGSGQHAAAKEIVKTIKDQDIFTDALTSLIRKHFAVPGWEMPE
jgi:hypothetical protein